MRISLRAAVIAALLVLAAAGAVVVGSRLLTEPLPEPLGDGQFVPGPALAGGMVDQAIPLRDGRVLMVPRTDQSEAFLLDPATGAMRPTVAPPRSLLSVPGVLLADGRVLFVGGWSHVEQRTATLFDPATETFRNIGRTAAPRTFTMLTLLADGRVLVAGSDANGAAAKAELFDPSTETFRATGPMSRPRAGDGGSALLADGRVLVVGGSGVEHDASAELFDPRTGTFTKTGSTSRPRHGFVTTPLPDGRVLLAGGYIENGNGTVEGTDTAEVYDPTTGRFSSTGSMRQPRIMHAAAAMPDGKVLLVGGATGWSEANPSLNPSRMAEVYDPATESFTPVGLMRYPRLNPIAVPTADGRFLVLGHLDPRGGRVPTAEDRLRGRTSEWFLPPAR